MLVIPQFLDSFRMAYSSELPSEDPLDPAARDFGPSILGQGLYEDLPPNKDLADDYTKIEMVRIAIHLW